MSFPEPNNPHLAGVAVACSEGHFSGGRTSTKIRTMLLGAICVCVLLGILAAGLWPFHAPRNEVSWLSGGNGLFFGKHGSIVSAGSFAANRSPSDSSCSIEIWLEPGRADSSSSILAFYLPASRIVPLALRQSLGDLKLERRSPKVAKINANKIYVNDVFSRLKLVFVTISSGETGTAFYVNGALVKKSATFRLSGEDLTGQIIIGNAPATTDSWSGKVKGLAIYDRELPPAEVSQDYANWTAGWTTSGRPDTAKSEGVVARYLFDEGKGSIINNQIDSATSLLIPERFFILHEQFLERPWDEFRTGWHYWKDVGINVAGFIPLGFFFRAYFWAVGRAKRATWLTIALGFAVSLTIEVLQAFLPTRDSGMTDVITNTFGTALGAIVCVWSIKRNCFARAGVSLVFPLEKRESQFRS